MLMLQICAAIPFVILLTQLYLYAITREGTARQTTCRGLGIVYTTIGIVSLVFRTPFFVLSGFILIMLGLLLIAKGLERLDKKIFIDSYAGDSEEGR